MSPDDVEEWTHRYHERVGILMAEGHPEFVAERLAKNICRRWLEREPIPNDERRGEG